MSHQKIDFKIDVSPGVQLAATLHMPAPERLTARPTLFIALPGGGYNRMYYDLPEPGYSQAEYHAEQGIATVALDHLGVGESTIPAPEACTLNHVADANAASLGPLLEMLAKGIGGAPAIIPGAIVGVGQSMGGFIATAMQARHRCFDAIALLGASAVCTRMPSISPEGPFRYAGDADPFKSAMHMFGTIDWRYGFHWEDVPEHLVAIDVANKPPVLGALAPWSSPTTPAIFNLVLPGVIAQEAAIIDVPVLLAMGERDVTQDPLRELAAFQSATDLALAVFPKMAHMHNFAGTRVSMWKRLRAFALQIADQKGF
jgi:pimeloyl-ACP methyl ester carboxylesterase